MRTLSHWSRSTRQRADAEGASSRALRAILFHQMSDSDCPYLRCERTAFRESLDLSEEAPMTVILWWSCQHPFHGIAVDFGDARLAVERHCAACTLPRPRADGGAD